MDKTTLVLVVHDVRSAHNVGSLLRTADGLGINKVYLTGYTPYPKAKNDDRLPHLSAKLERLINKTALGSQDTVSWEHKDDVFKLLENLKKQGFNICALEQSANSQSLPAFRSNKNIALICGNEVTGLDEKILQKTDICLEIPMLGGKESYNVAVSAAIALYHLRYIA